MPKLYSSKEIQTVLQKLGFYFVSQKGSHAKFRKNLNQTVILPMAKKEIPFGTFKSILRQAGMSLNDFQENL